MLSLIVGLLAFCSMCVSCDVSTDVFLPSQSEPEKKSRIPHPYQNLTVKKNGKGYRLFENQKDTETQHLSSADRVERITSYFNLVSQEEYCVSVQGQARKCNCLSFLRDKPCVIDKVALGMQKYFNLDKEGRNLWLTNEQRLVDRLTKLSNDPKKYQLPLFLSKPTGNKSDDC